MEHIDAGYARGHRAANSRAAELRKQLDAARAQMRALRQIREHT